MEEPQRQKSREISEITPMHVQNRSLLQNLFEEALQRNHARERIQRLSEHSPFIFRLYDKFGYTVLVLAALLVIWMPLFAGSLGLSVVLCVFAEIAFFALSFASAFIQISFSVVRFIFTALMSKVALDIFDIPIRFVQGAVSAFTEPMSFYNHGRETLDKPRERTNSDMISDRTLVQQERSYELMLNGSDIEHAHDNNLHRVHPETLPYLEKPEEGSAHDHHQNTTEIPDSLNNQLANQNDLMQYNSSGLYSANSTSQRRSQDQTPVRPRAFMRGEHMEIGNTNDRPQDMEAETSFSSDRRHPENCCCNKRNKSSHHRNSHSETPIYSSERARENGAQVYRETALYGENIAQESGVNVSGVIPSYSVHRARQESNANSYRETPLYSADRAQEAGVNAYRETPLYSEGRPHEASDSPTYDTGYPRRRRDSMYFYGDESYEDYGLADRAYLYITDYIHNFMTLMLFLFIFWSLTNTNNHYDRY